MKGNCEQSRLSHSFEALQLILFIIGNSYAISSALAIIWDKLFDNWPSKICGRHSLKKLKRNDLPKQLHFIGKVGNVHVVFEF